MRLTAAAGPIRLAAAVLFATVTAWAVYLVTLAPGLTWSHHGADGGDLLAAAVSNGVPHPSGYPFYTLLLQGWLALGRGLGATSPAWLGNLFSACCVGLSAGVTVVAVVVLLRDHPRREGWALVAGLAWALAPLPWSQALITEVYGLHALLAALIGLVALTYPRHSLWVGVLLGLGLAHHLTSVLLWPALFYALYRRDTGRAQMLRIVGIALLVAAAFYARIPLVAGKGPPPVNWGYATDWPGFWWLVSGAAYRDYLFALSLPELAGRILGVGRTLVDQVTPLGLIAVIAGAMRWDADPVRRTTGLLWALPLAGYAAAYVTVDSQVYLLPVMWLVMLWLGLGLAAADDALALRRAWQPPRLWALAVVALALLAAITLWREPQVSLRDDFAAAQFLADASATIAPGSLVISSADAPTFALWYGVWADGALDAAAPGAVYVNASLYEFGWYRRLMHDLYPDVAGIGAAWPELLAANRGLRPIFFTEADLGPPDEIEAAGPLWRLVTP